MMLLTRALYPSSNRLPDLYFGPLYYQGYIPETIKIPPAVYNHVLESEHTPRLNERGDTGGEVDNL
jgi:hypothetical protein